MENKKSEMNLEAAFNMLVQFARANKLTYAEHQKVTVAIETVMSALNKEEPAKEVRRLSDNDEQGE